VSCALVGDVPYDLGDRLGAAWAGRRSPTKTGARDRSSPSARMAA